MNRVFTFGEQIDGYSVNVLNERVVRAGAGILFALAVVSFMNAWLVGNFQHTRVFVVAFLVDFTIRIFVNPRYAPSLIIGQWFVRKQQPEYVGAPQKHFAWTIGFALGLIMLYLVVINNMIGPLNLIVCATCLVLLFFESAFGICLACKVYNAFHEDKAQFCPGGACEVAPTPRPGANLASAVIVVAFVGLMGGVAWWVAGNDPQAAALQHRVSDSQPAPVDAAEAERCKVPEFAKAMGHEDKWKLHNNCK